MRTFLKIVFQMYQGIESCIGIQIQHSELFPCNIGVHQGENLSPVLFSLYLNDLELYLQRKNCNVHIHKFMQGCDYAGFLSS